MEIEQITRESGQKEWFIDLDYDEAFDLAMKLLDSCRTKDYGNISMHNDFEWFNFSISPSKK